MSRLGSAAALSVKKGVKPKHLDPDDSMAAHYLRIAKDLGYELPSNIEEFLQGYREPGTSLGISQLG